MRSLCMNAEVSLEQAIEWMPLSAVLELAARQLEAEESDHTVSPTAPTVIPPSGVRVLEAA